MEPHRSKRGRIRLVAVGGARRDEMSRTKAPGTAGPFGSQAPSVGSRAVIRPRCARMRRDRRAVGGAIVAIIAVVVVAAAAVGGLFAAGIIKTGGGGGSGGSSTTYSVTFSEMGLAAGTSWSVSLAGSTQSSTGSSISFTNANGSYGFTASASGYSATPATGTVTVAGAPISQTISFAKVTTYAVVFSETGLGLGAPWTAVLQGSAQSSSSGSISFAEPNGSYSFSVSATGYSANPPSGSVPVSGTATNIAIHFTVLPPLRYSVTFTETGLTGTSWTVTFNGTSQSGTGSSIAFNGVANGAYSFQASAAGYTATPASGSVTVSGTNVTEPITFTPGGGGSSAIFSAAEASAMTASSSYQGGGWSAVVGEALAIPASYSFSGQRLTNLSSNCTISWIGSEPASVTIPATSSSASAGASNAWVIFLSQKAGSAYLLVIVLNGAPTLLYTASGGACTFYSELSLSGLIDSPQAVNAANGAGGSAFLSSHTGVSKVFFVIGSSKLISGGFGGLWEIVYSTCTINQASGTGFEFNATLNGTTGAVIHSGTESLSCASGGFAHASAPVGILGAPVSSARATVLERPMSAADPNVRAAHPLIQGPPSKYACGRQDKARCTMRS